jgi:hypothetical protein
MEVYILDSLFRRTHVIDRFESLIWTDRWRDVGDFQLVMNSTRENRSLLPTGTRLAINESHSVMTVETSEDNTAEDGRTTITFKGTSLETILKDRVARNTMNNLTLTDKWVITGPPAEVARTMFDAVCRDGALHLGDKISYLQPGTMFPESTLPEYENVIRWEQEPDSLYNATKSICDVYDLGFRLTRNFDTSQLFYEIYAGDDRTTGQMILDPVVFSNSLDNLQNVTEYNSIADAKNVAYVFSEQGSEVVYSPSVDPEIESFERRAMFVRADALPTDPTPPTASDISAYLIQIGAQELAKHQAWFAFDGEHSTTSGYKYGVHYNLGDLVEMQNNDGALNNMRVTEQIFSSDEQGDRSYPTLAINLAIYPGSWLAWNYNQVWLDLDADTTSVWANQD